MSSKRKLASALAVSAALLPVSLMAKDFSYTYGEIGYLYGNGDVRGFDFDGNSGEFRGAFALNEQIFLAGRYDSGRFEFDRGGHFDADAWSVGLGGHVPLDSNVDLLGTVSYVGTDVDHRNRDGVGLDLGIRVRPADQFEIGGGIGYVNIDDNSSYNFSAEGRYYFTDALSLGAGISTDDHGAFTQYGINLRAELK